MASVGLWDGAAGAGGSSGGGAANSDANACQPGSVATYRPDAYHPASGWRQGVCTAAAITAFYDECLGPDAATDGCNAVHQTDAACIACILTPPTAPKYGPILDHAGFVTANVAGCLELAGDQQSDSSELPCAKAVQALAGCGLAACEANCPVDDPASLTEYQACFASAEVGGCQSYTAAAECAESQAEASVLETVCLSDFVTFYQVVVPDFCGSPLEAAADAGTAADASASPDAGSAADSGTDGSAPGSGLDAAVDAFIDAPGE
jgi:hypothetical protein